MWNTETLGCVINFTCEKVTASQSSSSCHYFRLLRGQACPHGGLITRESVPRLPLPPWTTASPSDRRLHWECGWDLPLSCGCFNCSEKSLLKAVLGGGGSSLPGFHMQQWFLFSVPTLSMEISFSLAHSVCWIKILHTVMVKNIN